MTDKNTFAEGVSYHADDSRRVPLDTRAPSLDRRDEALPAALVVPPIPMPDPAPGPYARWRR